MPEPVTGFPDAVGIEERGGGVDVASAPPPAALCELRTDAGPSSPDRGFSLPAPPSPPRFQPETTG
ncbi:hypothetical protein Q0Z83_034150 [Actinoplanes sichuanensis]|uniref:Uncharacterized protein n=1 Tax=Actinoplanes sichuanensis TaxID=512349 RepID=A0ABW4AUU4_9ACTN|nr:hypothetical protein [Actinoplanes sichuanensis]BEL05224.1 hypothetical protein Q0Z83_034150 [Actinoplanes sichuanensis]